MLSKKTIAQLNGLFISTVYKDEFGFPPKVFPITFKTNEAGADLMEVLKDLPFQAVSSQIRLKERTQLFNDIKAIGDFTIDLAFLRRNYDMSESYYLVTDMTWAQLDAFLTLVSNQKGGVL